MSGIIKIKPNDAATEQLKGECWILRCSYCNFYFPIEPKVLDLELDPHAKVIEADVLKMEEHWNTVHKDIADEARPRAYICNNELCTPKGIDHMIIVGRDNISYEILWYSGTSYDRRELSNEEKGMVEVNPKWNWERGSKYDRYQWKAKDKEGGGDYGPDKWNRWCDHLRVDTIESTLDKLKAKYSFLDVHNPRDVRVSKNLKDEFYKVEWNSRRLKRQMEDSEEDNV